MKLYRYLRCAKCNSNKITPIACPECEPGKYDCYDEDCYFCEGDGYRYKCEECKKSHTWGEVVK